MSVYVRYLREAFPYVADVPYDVAERCVEELMKPFMGGVGGVELKNGSSFAQTADASGEGIRRLWLSAVSLERLADADLLTDVLIR